MPNEESLRVATKVEKYDKWQWFDYVIVGGIGLVIMFTIPLEASFFVRILIFFGCGAFIGAIYSVTLRMLWVRRFPNLYRRWTCSNCQAIVSEEATKCSKCGAQFGEEHDSCLENKSLNHDASGNSIADYNKAIELAPGNADAYYKRGDVYDEMEEYGKALADYSKAIQLNPNYVDAYYNRGCAYGEIGKYEEAIADYNKVIELRPNDALAYYNRGLAYHEKGEVNRAVSDLEKCIELSTDLELTKDAQQELSEIVKSSL